MAVWRIFERVSSGDDVGSTTDFGSLWRLNEATLLYELRTNSFSFCKISVLEPLGFHHTSSTQEKGSHPNPILASSCGESSVMQVYELCEDTVKVCATIDGESPYSNPTFGTPMSLQLLSIGGGETAKATTEPSNDLSISEEKKDESGIALSHSLASSESLSAKTYLMSGGEGGTVQLWDVISSKLVWDKKISDAPVMALSCRTSIKKSKSKKKTKQKKKNPIATSTSFSSSSSSSPSSSSSSKEQIITCVVGSSTNSVGVCSVVVNGCGEVKDYDREEFSSFTALELSGEGVNEIAWRHDGKVFAVASWDGRYVLVLVMLSFVV